MKDSRGTVVGGSGRAMEQLKSHGYILSPDFFDYKGGQMGRSLGTLQKLVVSGDQLCLFYSYRHASADGHDPGGVHR